VPLEIDVFYALSFVVMVLDHGDEIGNAGRSVILNVIEHLTHDRRQRHAATFLVDGAPEKSKPALLD
jgi:hypothetical protein